MDSLNQLDGEYDTVKQLLKLSYDKLQCHLKPCFAHLSLFPKDHDYVPYYQLYCYSALGLVELCDGSYFKNNFFNELLSRSMLQNVDWGSKKRISKFKIHDLLHDLARDLLGEELAVVSWDKLSVPNSSRYVAWGLGSSNDEFPEQVKPKKARAFLFQFQMGSVSQSFLKGVISNMPCLRILGLGSSQFEELPRSIKNLKHLRVLDLSKNPLIKSLPDSVCELLNLECLLLEGCKQLQKLPAKIYKLINLRLLSLTTCQTSLAGTKFNRLPSLRHLLFDSCLGLVSLWDSEDVGFLTSLRSLHIYDCPKLESLPSSMEFLVGLEELWIANCEELHFERRKGLKGLQSLETVAIKRVPRLSWFPDDSQSTNSSLKNIIIEDCKGLVVLPRWGQPCVPRRLFTGNTILMTNSLLPLTSRKSPIDGGKNQPLVSVFNRRLWAPTRP